MQVICITEHLVHILRHEADAEEYVYCHWHNNKILKEGDTKSSAARLRVKFDRGSKLGFSTLCMLCASNTICECCKQATGGRRSHAAIIADVAFISLCRFP